MSEVLKERVVWIDRVAPPLACKRLGSLIQINDFPHGWRYEARLDGKHDLACAGDRCVAILAAQTLKHASDHVFKHCRMNCCYRNRLIVSQELLQALHMILRVAVKLFLYLIGTGNGERIVRPR